MINYISALIYICVSIVTWIAICFNISDIIWGEDVLFRSKKRAIFLYIISIGISIFMTLIGYIIVGIIQRIH